MTIDDIRAEAAAALYLEGQTPLAEATIRDFFAAAALIALNFTPDLDMSKEEMAVWSFSVADEMVEER